jgi:hypothetical protein
MLGRISGRRIHFAGSADIDVEPGRLKYFHSLIRHIAKRTLLEGGGLILTLGSEPLHETEHDLPLIFDWTLLEALDECRNRHLQNWPETQGAQVIAVGLPKWRERVPEGRKALLERLLSINSIQVIQIRSGLSIGGVLRERQATFGDILVVAGGGPGVEHLVELYKSNCKPVIPLDIELRAKESAAERLSINALENPEEFFDYRPSHQATGAFLALSFKNHQPHIEEFEKRFFNFLFHLPRPRAFFVRLLNKELSEHKEVDRFFRNVVDQVVENAGYERFEMGKESSKQPFLNVEIFQVILSSSLVLVDLTGLRSDCLVELGYAIGLRKKVIITSQEGTRLPFDSASLPCHFWSITQSDVQRKTELQDFIKKNIIRKPIIES